MATTTFRTLCADVARQIPGGRYQNNFVAPAAVGPDLGRWLLTPTLRSDGGEPIWKGAWVRMISGASAQVRVTTHVPGIGGIRLDQVVSASAVVQGSEFETSWPLPMTTTQGTPGVDYFVIRAGWEVWYEDTIDLTPGSGDYTVSLTDQKAWLTEERVCRDTQGRPLFYDPPILTGYPQQHAPWRYGEINQQAGVPTLRLRQAYGDSLDASEPAQLCVIRPVSSLVSGAESATGPSATTDTVGGDPAELQAVALLHCYRFLAGAAYLSDSERQRYAALVPEQEAYVRANVRHWLPRDEMAGQAGRAA